MLGAVLCQDLQGQPAASGISGPVIQGERIWYEAPLLGLAGKDQKLGRTRMGWSISLAWLLGSSAGNRILRLDGVVPGKSPTSLFSSVLCAWRSFRSEGAGPFLLVGPSGNALALSASKPWALSWHIYECCLLTSPIHSAILKAEVFLYFEKEVENLRCHMAWPRSHNCIRVVAPTY